MDNTDRGILLVLGAAVGGIATVTSFIVAMSAWYYEANILPALVSTGVFGAVTSLLLTRKAK